MVKKIKQGNKEYFICEECNFEYLDKDIAKKCENWCKKHKSCNIEITKHSVGIYKV